MNTYNNIPLNCFNSLVTDKAKFDTLFKVEVTEEVSEKPFVYVNPEIWHYGLEGSQLSCMDVFYYEWNKALFEMGLTPEQMKKLENIASTQRNFSHRAGFRSGEKHAKSMAILYPKIA